MSRSPTTAVPANLLPEASLCRENKGGCLGNSLRCCEDSLARYSWCCSATSFCAADGRCNSTDAGQGGGSSGGSSSLLPLIIFGGAFGLVLIVVLFVVYRKCCQETKGPKRKATKVNFDDDEESREISNLHGVNGREKGKVDREQPTLRGRSPLTAPEGASAEARGEEAVHHAMMQLDTQPNPLTFGLTELSVSVRRPASQGETPLPVLHTAVNLEGGSRGVAPDLDEEHGFSTVGPTS
jgi:hypothetical protein